MDAAEEEVGDRCLEIEAVGSIHGVNLDQGRDQEKDDIVVRVVLPLHHLVILDEMAKMKMLQLAILGKSTTYADKRNECNIYCIPMV